jgi:hypothetical protein
MNILINIFLLALSASVSSLPQSGNSGTTLVKTDAGILWVENKNDAYFIIEIVGDEIRPMAEYPFLSVDGRPMQVHLIEIEKFYKATEKTRVNDLPILQAYRDWEADHHGKLLNSKLAVKSEPISLGQDREALLWSYSMYAALNKEVKEKNKEQVEEQYFLTTLIGNHLLLLNTVLKTGEPSNTARELLVKTLSTLRISTKPIDVKALQESIRKNGKISLPN